MGAHRCNTPNYFLNKYTGKCVPRTEKWLDPQNCRETSCGHQFYCDTKTILCLKKSGETAPVLKKCAEVYGTVYGQDWWGETASELALGFTFDSDEEAEETAVAVDAEGPNTLCVPRYPRDFVSGMAHRCNTPNYFLNKYTGKCVPRTEKWLDPQNCRETSCGHQFYCDTKTILCLKKTGETAPVLKKCAEVYGT